MISGFVREFEKLLGPSSVLYRSRIWKAGRARPRPHRARLSPLLACQRRAQLCFPAPAPRSPSHHRRRTRFAFLSTLRFAGHRAQYWCLETSWCGRARTSPPAHRRLFFLSLPRLDVSCRRSRVAFFSGCVANVTFSQLNEAHHPRPRPQRLRSGHPKGPALLRRAGCAFARSRWCPRSRSKESLPFLQQRLRRHHHQRRWLRFHAQGIRSSLFDGRG